MIGWSGFSGCVWRTKDGVLFINGVYGTEVVLAKTCCVLNNCRVPLKRTLMKYIMMCALLPGVEYVPDVAEDEKL